MDKRVIAVVTCLLVLLIACGAKTTGKRVALPESGKGPTGSVANGITGAAIAPTPNTGETGKTAAEALKELQNNPTATPESKTGNFYPPITTTATGKAALQAKTDALMKQQGYNPTVKAQTTFGPKYYGSGMPTPTPTTFN